MLSEIPVTLMSLADYTTLMTLTDEILRNGIECAHCPRILKASRSEYGIEVEACECGAEEFTIAGQLPEPVDVRLENL
jgi:hypothetical protein